MMQFPKFKELIESGNEAEFIRQLTLSLKSTDPINLTYRDPEHGCSLLDWAAIYNRSKIAAFLVEHEPRLLITPTGVRSSLQYAARHGCLECLNVFFVVLGGELRRQLEYRDGNRKTALELALQYNHLQCARLLINHGAVLPLQAAPLTQLNSRDYVLYCDSNGMYQLLTQDEVAAVEKDRQTNFEIQGLSLQQSRAGGKRALKKAYIQPLAVENPLVLLYVLIDKFLYLFNRQYKEMRDYKHSAQAEQFQIQLQRNVAKRTSLRSMIQLLDIVLRTNCLDHSQFVSEACSQQYLQRILQEITAHQGRYYGDDLSDDSDSDDEKSYIRYTQNPKPEKGSKSEHYLKVSKKQNHQFWSRAKLVTPENAGLKGKLTRMVEQLKKGFDENQQLSQLSGILDNKSLQNRGKIDYGSDVAAVVAKVIKAFNDCKPENLPDLIARSRPIFILGTRGINYMLDRWNADARRYHRQIEERQHPQFSEAVLKTLSYDYYTELEAEHDFHNNEVEHLALLREAARLGAFLQSLNDSLPCVDFSAHHKGPYYFNSVGDCLQDHFSNGVDDHLDDLAKKRRDHPNYWGVQLRNSFNPGMAIGSRPYHALKYTFGLKDYYPRSMLPRYWRDGTIEYSHVGKVYLSLHPLQEVLSDKGPNNLSIQDRQARVSIKDLVSPEKELSFLGYMPGDRVFHQFVAKFPSFKKDWKNIYQFKYGLDRETYNAFRYLINITAPETVHRNSLIDLLSEWLCAYHEVLLIEIAKEEALRRGGILAYVNREGKLTLTPENGRIFTSGKTNIALRNEVRTLRRIRLQLANRIGDIRAKISSDKKSIPGFSLIDADIRKSLLMILLNDNAFLDAITEKYKLTTEEQGLQFAAGAASDVEIKRRYGRAVVENIIKNGFYARPTITFNPMIVGLENQGHLYTDLEINTLIANNLNGDDVALYAPQHPLVQGELQEATERLFIDAMNRIFQIGRLAVMPIEINEEALDEAAQLQMNGIHWNGLVFRPVPGNVPEQPQFVIELIDPAHSPNADVNLTALTAELVIRQHGNAVGRLLGLIKLAAEQCNVRIEVRQIRTQQQAGDLDCGAWTVDNLRRRGLINPLPLRTNAEVTGQQLRQQHSVEYNQVVNQQVPQQSHNL